MAFRHAIHNVYKAGAEYVMPVRSQSGYKESGVRFLCLIVMLSTDSTKRCISIMSSRLLDDVHSYAY